MDENTKQKIALFRYSLIAPLLTNTFPQATAKAYLEYVCDKVYDVPYYGKREFAPSTLKGWLIDFRKKGVEGLYPVKRSDAGESRVLSNNARKCLTEMKTMFPERSVKSLYHELAIKGIIDPGAVSISAVQRYIQNHRLNKLPQVHKDRRAFSMEFPGDCWQSDLSQGPYLHLNGRKLKTHLIAFIDDASRAIMACSFSFEENLVSVLSIFKQAIQRRGIPKKLFLDNGKVFRSDQLQLICASLGTVVSYAAPYSAASKGKIERWFQTLQSQWLNTFDWTKITSLGELNEKLHDYVENQYHHTVHSVIKAKPLEKYFEHISKIRFVPSRQELDSIFLYRAVRKVKNDATISISNILFEVPAQYIGEQVQVRYDPSCMDKAYIFDENGNCLHTIVPVNRIDNSRIPRGACIKPIDFSSFSHDKEV